MYIGNKFKCIPGGISDHVRPKCVCDLSPFWAEHPHGVIRISDLRNPRRGRNRRDFVHLRNGHRRIHFRPRRGGSGKCIRQAAYPCSGEKLRFWKISPGRARRRDYWTSNAIFSWTQSEFTRQSFAHARRDLIPKKLHLLLCRILRKWRLGGSFRGAKHDINWFGDVTVTSTVSAGIFELGIKNVSIPNKSKVSFYVSDSSYLVVVHRT